MSIKYKIFKNLYRDSVTLMQLSSQINQMQGVKLASALMATPANISMMKEAGLVDEAPVEATPADLLFVVRGSEEVLDDAIEQFSRNLDGKIKSSKEKKEKVSTTIYQSLNEMPDANLAIISVPGEYAYAESLKALQKGLNVMIFSDNVSIEDEISLKKYADEKGLLVMGPDCGTAIISGIPLAFANRVEAGHIGVVGASGTGVQEVTTLISKFGGGISHAIGTGGRDLSADVGGLTMAAGIRALEADSKTKVITLISKPPAKQTAANIFQIAESISKPVVVCFLGYDYSITKDYHNIYFVDTLEEAAHRSIELLCSQAPAFKSLDSTSQALLGRADRLTSRLADNQKHIRGMYSGGTFCFEALLSLRSDVSSIYSNISVERVNKLTNPWKSEGHTVIDLGDDEFTRGKPHPMIDPSIRNERILIEAQDPSTAVILFDVVIGFGANTDPAKDLAAVIKKAKSDALKNGRDIIFIGFVCGTNEDFQRFDHQSEILEEAGAVLCGSNANAVALAGAILRKIAE